MKRSKNNETARGVVVLLFLIFVLSILPLRTDAISIFSPFGGKVTAYMPTAPGCAVFTTAVSIATLGVINPTVEELVVGSKTLGILRIDGFTIPGLTTIYEKKFYQAPGTWVLGNSINVCDVCGAAEDIPIVSSICKIGVVSDILDVVCDFVGSTCPIGNLVHKMGTSGIPSSK